jgi:hypothetical protein
MAGYKFTKASVEPTIHSMLCITNVNLNLKLQQITVFDLLESSIMSETINSLDM